MPKRKTSSSNLKSPTASKRAKTSNNNNTTAEQCVCSCKKTLCLKSYCECFKRGLRCSDACKCQNCENYPESEKLKKIQSEKAKKMSQKKKKSKSKKKLATVLSEVSQRNTEQMAKINKLKNWIGKDSVNNLSNYLIQELQKEETSFERQCQLLEQQQQQQAAASQEAVVAQTPSTPAKGNNSDTANHNTPKTTTTTTTTTTTAATSTPSNPTNAKQALSPETMSLLCDETDAVQAASRVPNIAAGTPARVSFRSPSKAQQKINHDTELGVVLEKKVLMTFKKYLTRMMNDIDPKE